MQRFYEDMNKLEPFPGQGRKVLYNVGVETAKPRLYRSAVSQKKIFRLFLQGRERCNYSNRVLLTGKSISKTILLHRKTVLGLALFHFAGLANMKRAFSTLLSSSLLAAGVAVAGSALTATTAQAFSLYIDPQYGSSNSPATGSTAQLDFNFTQSGANVLLNLGIKNTTGSVTSSVQTSGATQSTLVGVGFDLASIISSYTYNSGTSAFTQLYGDSSYNNQVQGEAKLEPFDTFDVGIRSAGSGNFSGGNPQQGLTAGQSSSVSFVLKGNNLNASSVESAFKSGFDSGKLEAVGRFQQVGGVNYSGATSDKVKAGTKPPGGGSGGGGPHKIPEPATLAGLGLVAASLVTSRRRQVSKTA